MQHDTHPLPKSAYSIAEFERTIGISHATVYELIKAGEIRTFNIGRRRFVSAAAVQEFIAAREKAAA